MTRMTTLTQGLWTQNPALVQLLGLCPLLAVSNTIATATGLAIATLAVLVGANLSISLIRAWVPDTIRLPAFILVIAALTTCAERLVQAYDYNLYESLGIFLPLIVTNCLILGRADALARRTPPWASFLDGIGQGLGFGLALIALGALRELAGSVVLLAILPPGAFIGLGILVAAHRLIHRRLVRPQDPASLPSTETKRVRTTGDVT
ncbi:MAG: electron transport complex subunit E [Litorivicinaceae bacterium]|jgi:Na+-translocating ferredoxin:NAD+ oxidoreductase subunit E|nr:electron transport complex subunit E [Litorivicinaceae bacterium]MDP5328310.1 electron transport complex subunit E [Litorivicinaceae bacterium]MDP5329933.1 electron transport complex subunit E [Litorivicinaceae bacterium]MDP5339773.1 electron transport complex subunit E [Litorivicinaceae bacterium]MDP5341580.1 electron transport complex subunit E [Litorivicinaceae bacterium]